MAHLPVQNVQGGVATPKSESKALASLHGTFKVPVAAAHSKPSREAKQVELKLGLALSTLFCASLRSSRAFCALAKGAGQRSWPKELAKGAGSAPSCSSLGLAMGARRLRPLKHTIYPKGFY